MGFESKCNIFKLSESGVKNSKLKIFNMWLISLDHASIYISSSTFYPSLYENYIHILVTYTPYHLMFLDVLGFYNNNYWKKPVSSGWKKNRIFPRFFHFGTNLRTLNLHPLLFISEMFWPQPFIWFLDFLRYTLSNACCAYNANC